MNQGARGGRTWLLSIGGTLALLVALEGGLRLASVGAGYWDRQLPPTVMRDPELWVRLRPSVRYESRDSGTIVTSTHGTRGPEFPVPKPAGRVRVVCVGDSVTFGWGVAADEAYPALLERALRASARDVDVVNAGQPSYSSFQGRILLERELLGYGPDIVTFAFGHNDGFGAPRSDRAERARDRGLARRAQRLLRRSRLYTALAMVLLRKPAAGGAGPDFRGGLADPASAVARVDPAAFRDNLTAVVDDCRRAAVELVLVTEPRRDRKPSPYNEVVRDVGREQQVRVVDLELLFAPLAPGPLFVDNVHPSVAGHRLFASAIMDAIGSRVRGSAGRP